MRPVFNPIAVLANSFPSLSAGLLDPGVSVSSYEYYRISQNVPSRTILKDDTFPWQLSISH